MTHDLATQQAETFKVFADLQAEHGLPDIADVDYFLVPASDDANWRELADVLSRQGFDCQFVEDANEPYLVATLADQAISAQGIWTGEDVATRHALDLGFRPDGWGLEG